jgi:hypothetical protein
MSELLNSLLETAISGVHTSPEVKQQALDRAHAMMGRHVPDIYLLHMITLDALAQVNFDRHAGQGTEAPEFKPSDVLDELLHRFCLRTLADAQTLKAIAEVEQAERELSKLVGRVTTRLCGVAGREDDWVFLEEGQRLICRLQGFQCMKNAIRSSTSKTRDIFYPEPPKDESSALQAFFKKNLGDRHEKQHQLALLSDAILVEKVMGMICQSELQKYTLDYPVYGVKTLMMYLPAVIDRLIGEPSERLSLEYCQTHLNALKATTLKLNIIETSLQRSRGEPSSEPAGF